MNRLIHQLPRKGTSEILSWSSASDETLLQSARSQGIELSSSCENGTCRTCLLQSAQATPALHYTTDWPGLTPEEKLSGFLLPCVAKAQEPIDFEPSTLLRAQCSKAFCVIFENECLLALYKPSGLLTVPGKGPDKQDCLTSRVQALRGSTVLTVHRLDQATSGLVIMAKGQQHQRTLSMAFARQDIQKRYLAVVKGKLPLGRDWQDIDLPIDAHWPDRPKRRVHQDGKPSKTRYRSWASNSSATLLEIEPLSGRTHQIRVHLQAIGHPIWGDQLYAPKEVANASPRLLLHAWTLQLNDPLSHEKLILQYPETLLLQNPSAPSERRKAAPCPIDWQHLVRRLNWHEIIDLKSFDEH